METSKIVDQVFPIFLLQGSERNIKARSKERKNRLNNAQGRLANRVVWP